MRTKSGDEEVRAPRFLGALQGLAGRVGGEAPLPAVPDMRFVEDLSHLAGNEQLAAILEAKGEIEGAVGEWERLGGLVEGRRRGWDLAVALCRHAEGELQIAEEVRAQLDAVKEQRSLLAGTDHVAPCLAKLVGALRGELAERHRKLEEAVVGATDALGGDATWRKLDCADRRAILGRVGLERPAPLSVETNEAVKKTLDARRLAAWGSEIDAVPERLARALEEAAKRSRGKGPPPVTVKIEPVTLSDRGCRAAVGGGAREDTHRGGPEGAGDREMRERARTQ